MQSKATNPLDYLKEVPVERREAFSKLRQTILKNLPKGFEERMTLWHDRLCSSRYNLSASVTIAIQSFHWGMMNLASQKILSHCIIRVFIYSLNY
ncbi:MAG: hypothetical protein WKF59_00625 [Chitinophagaceae bacterium]